jgi:hypothetical protein
MDVYEFIETVGAEITSNKALLRQGRTYVTLAKHDGAQLVLTPEGAEMMRGVVERIKLEAVREVVDEKPKVVRRRRARATTPVVEAEAEVESEAEVEPDIDDLFEGLTGHGNS